MKDLGLWYQEAVIDGVKMPRRRKDSDTSERRWQLFIEPLLVPDGKGKRFVELGCNAGYYLRKARELGYEAIGVENNPTYLAQAKYWEEKEPMGVKLIEADLNAYKMPVCHTVLLANILYWLTPEQVSSLIKTLSHRAMKVIVIGRHRPLKQHISPCDNVSITNYFHSWLHWMGNVDAKHYSILFFNPNIMEVPIDYLQIHGYGTSHKGDLLEKSFLHLLNLIDNKRPYNPAATRYYKYLHANRIKRSKRTGLFKRYTAMFHDIKQHGLSEPLYISNDGKIKDGDHRYLIAKYLKHKTILCTTAYYRHVPSRNKIKEEDIEMAKTRMRKLKKVRMRKPVKKRKLVRKRKKILKAKPF